MCQTCPHGLQALCSIFCNQSSEYHFGCNSSNISIKPCAERTQPGSCPFWSYEGFAFSLRFSTFNTGKQASLHAVSTPDQLTYTASKVWEMLLLFVSMQMVCNALFGSWISVQGREDLSSYLLIDREIRFVWDSPPLQTCQLLGKTKTWNASGCLTIEKCFFSLQLLFATNGRQGT